VCQVNTRSSEAYAVATTSDIAGHQRCMPSLRAKSKVMNSQSMLWDCAFGISTATSLKKFFGGKANGGIPPVIPPWSERGVARTRVFPYACEIISCEAKPVRGQASGNRHRHMYDRWMVSGKAILRQLTCSDVRLGSRNPRFTSLSSFFLWLNRNSIRNPRANPLGLHLAVFSRAGLYSQLSMSRSARDEAPKTA
jgi:hypothetical protein